MPVEAGIQEVILVLPTILREGPRSLLGDGNKSGVSNHSINGTGAAFVHQPVPLHQLKRPDIGKAMGFKLFEDQLHLPHIGAEINQQSPLSKNVCHGADAMPGFGQIEKNTVYFLVQMEILDVGDDDLMIRRMLPEELADVLTRLQGKLQPFFDGDELSAPTQRPQQGQSHGARTDSRFNHRVTGPDIPVEYHSTQVFRIDDLGGSNHGKKVFFESGPEEKELGPVMSLQAVSFLPADDVSHHDHAQMAGKGCLLDFDQPLLAFLGGQQDPFTHSECRLMPQKYLLQVVFASSLQSVVHHKEKALHKSI